VSEESEPRNPEVIPSNTGHAGTDKAPERWVSFLGFVIVTKGDLLAAAAFLLSLVSVIYQLSSWIKGPSPSVYPPELIYVFFDHRSSTPPTPGTTPLCGISAWRQLPQA
jgi:hypothetical protein